MEDHSTNDAAIPAQPAVLRTTTWERYAIDGSDELRLDGIPAELKAIPRWVAWRADPKPGADKPGKCPVNPRTGGNAMSNNAATWGTFEQAVDRCRRDKLAGIGLVFLPGADGDHDIVGIDLDHCWDAAKGDFSVRMAANLCANLKTYAEVSPSGTGVKLWARVPPGMRFDICQRKGARDGEEIKVEVYRAGRFFAVTGHRIDRFGTTLAECGEQVRQLTTKPRGKAGPPGADSKPGAVPATGNVADEEAMLRAALRFLDADSEPTWFRYGCCLKWWGTQPGVGDDTAKALWEGWSRTSPKFDAAEADEKWGRLDPDRGLTVGTLFMEAEAEGYEYGDATAADGTAYRVERKEPWQEDMDWWLSGAHGDPDHSPRPKPPEQFYYDAARKEYLLKNGRGVWHNLTESQFRKELAIRGHRTKARDDELVSEVDRAIIGIRDKFDVAYSGPLAGHPAGFYEAGDHRMLVTASPRIIEPKPGAFPTLDRFLSGLLDEPGLRQRDYLHGWLKVAYESLRRGSLRYGQALAIAGPHGCGKSLLQAVVTEILGGRYARPYQYMMGLTQFNSDLFEAEHLMMEDEQSSTDIRARRSFGAQIKQVAASTAQRCHAKNRPALSLKPFWRLTITLNDEAENLMVLPPLDDSLEDKLIILHAHASPMPMPTRTDEEKTAFWARLSSELPAFLHWLVNWRMPPELESQRYGVAHFHHPAILAAVDALSPESRLLALIDTAVFAGRTTAWEGTADALEKELSASDSVVSFEARRLFTFNTACGVYLARLAKKHPGRFRHTRGAECRRWTILPPGAPTPTGHAPRFGGDDGVTGYLPVLEIGRADSGADGCQSPPAPSSLNDGVTGSSPCLLGIGGEEGVDGSPATATSATPCSTVCQTPRHPVTEESDITVPAAVTSSATSVTVVEATGTKDDGFLGDDWKGPWESGSGEDAKDEEVMDVVMGGGL